jgi:AcrR family transcriptional regulator
VAQPTRSRTRLAREERREQIVDAAGEVFIGRDPSEVTFEEIADAAGVSRALVYNYFGDRHGLLEAVHTRHVHQLQALVAAAMAEQPVHRDALAAAVMAHLDFAVAEPGAYRSAVGALSFPRLNELQQERAESVARNLGGGDDARLVARGMTAAIHSMVIYWLDSGGVDAERTCEVVTTFVWGGLGDLDRLGLRIQPLWLTGASTA